MDISISKNDFIDIVVSGRIDATTANTLEEKVTSEIETANVPVGMNLKDVEYISSAGRRVILKIAKALNPKSIKFFCYDLQPTVAEVFKISGFNLIIKIYDSKEQALENI